MKNPHIHKPGIPTPDKCPEPFWHETHNYCPCCTWVRETKPSPTVTIPREEYEVLITTLKQIHKASSDPGMSIQTDWVHRTTTAALSRLTKRGVE